MTAAERAEHQRRVAAMRADRQAEEARVHAAARAEAARIWQAASPATDAHPYLVAKGIQPHGLRERRGVLVAPLRDEDGALHSIQTIAADGTKLFLTGGRVKGCYYAIGTPGETLLIAEGVATAASLHEATGLPAAAALSAGNLRSVAESLRHKFPAARVIVCADFDTSGRGLKAAQDAAAAVGGAIANPAFGADRQDGATDFNDLARHAGPEAVRQCIEAAERSPVARAAAGDLLPAIVIKAGDLPGTVHGAARALAAGGAPIYRRGTDLFRAARLAEDDRGPVRRAAGSVVLRFVTPEWLQVELATAAAWRKWDERQRKELPTNPTAALAGLLLARADDFPWPNLRAIARHPVVTLDGRVIAAPGFDRDTGLLLDFLGAWPVPSNPSRADAMAAVAILSDLLRHYPWAGPADLSVALSLLVSALMRPVLPTAPLHGIDAPEAGSGKSLLADVAAILATGSRASALDYGRNPEEAGKRLDAALLAGDPLICLDNCEAPLEGAALCQTLTAQSRVIRVLGLSKMVTTPCTALVVATGNNLTLRGDVVRRAVVCRLDPGTDRPELRNFDQDLIAETTERRAELVAAALTIPLAYIRAGRTAVDLPPLGSFEDWSATVRAALVWAGTADPCATSARVRESDPSRQTALVMLTLWAGRFGREGCTAARAVEAAESDAELREALAEVCTTGGKLDARRLGTWLRGRRDTRAGNLVLRSRSARGGAASWYVDPGDYGDCGDCPTVSTRESVRESRDTGAEDVTHKGKGLAGQSPHSPQSPSSARGPSRTACPRCDGEGCGYCRPRAAP